MAEAKKVQPTVDQVLATAVKKYGLRLGPLATRTQLVVPVVSTGNFAIDHILGVGGLPIGRSIELYGPPGSGKTTLAVQAAASLQHRIIAEDTDEKIVYLDYEHALDHKYAKALGLDVDHSSFLFGQPDNFEQGGEVLRMLVQTGKVRMSIVDSVAAMTPADYFTLDRGGGLALHARLMGELMKPLNSELHQFNTCAVWLNHLTEQMVMGGRPGAKKTSTTGGRALKFFASVRIEMMGIANVKGKVYDDLTNAEVEVAEATQVRVRIPKNKLAPPFRETEVRVRYGRGFDEFWSALQVLAARKLIVAGGQGYYYFEKSPELVHEDMARQSTGNKRPYIQGERLVLDFADERPVWRSKVIAAAKSAIAGGVEVEAGSEPDHSPEAMSFTDAEVEAALRVESSGGVADLSGERVVSVVDVSQLLA